MLEVYSKNVTVGVDSSIPLNNVALLKGTSSQLSGGSSIQLNKCGIYQISVSATVVGSGAGLITLQMRKDGVLQPQAVVLTSAPDATSSNAISFTTLVQVPQNNCINCVCSSPTVIEFVNTGIAATYSQFDITVIRV